MAAAHTKVSLKLLVDTKTHKVVFAEAGKEFVDFLFNLLSLPVGTVIRILSAQSMVGSIGKVYESVETLNDTYKQASQATLDALLKPKINASAAVPLLLPSIHTPVAVPLAVRDIPLYSCNCVYKYDYGHVTTDPSTKCPNSGSMINKSLEYVDPPNSQSYSPDQEGYVKGVVTYMVMDNLEVRPMSMISSITMLNKFNIKDIGVLEEKVVDVGMNEGVKLLKASLHSKSVLSEVFLVKEGTTVSISEVDSWHLQELFKE